VLLAYVIISLGWQYYLRESVKSTIKSTVSSYYNNEYTSSSSDDIELYTNIYYYTSVIALILILVFLFNASKYLMESDTLETTFENNEEILTSGERMKRMAEDSQ